MLTLTLDICVIMYILYVSYYDTKTKTITRKTIIIMSKQRVPVSVFVVLILMVITSLALSFILRDLGVSMIYCLIPIAIALIYTAAVEKLSKIERHRAEVILEAIRDKKMSEEEFVTYLVGVKYYDLSDECISIIQSALELDNPELMGKAKGILNDPELIKKTNARLSDSELAEEIKKIFQKARNL